MGNIGSLGVKQKQLLLKLAIFIRKKILSYLGAIAHYQYVVCWRQSMLPRPQAKENS